MSVTTTRKELEQEVQQDVAKPVHLNSVTAVLARRQQYDPPLNKAEIVGFQQVIGVKPSKVMLEGGSSESGPMNGPISVAQDAQSAAKNDNVRDSRIS